MFLRRQKSLFGPKSLNVTETKVTGRLPLFAITKMGSGNSRRQWKTQTLEQGIRNTRTGMSSLIFAKNKDFRVMIHLESKIHKHFQRLNWMNQTRDTYHRPIIT